MSGRSAYVRKEKTKIKDGGPVSQEGGSDRATSIRDFPMPSSSAPTMNFHQPPLANRSYQPQNHNEVSTTKSGSNGSEERGYARVQKPNFPIIVESGIEKSSFRSMMDKKSDGMRQGLAKTFGRKKKKKEDERPSTSNTIRAAPYELDTGNYVAAGSYAAIPSARVMYGESEYGRPGPPQSKLPAVPHGPQIKRWIGANRAAQSWNKLRKDPELWDPNGDTLVYFGRSDPYGRKPQPSFRISSHVIERTESRFLTMMLRQGSTEEHTGFNMPPSPVSSHDLRPAFNAHPGERRHHQTPPISENSSRGFEGQISYEIFFDPPSDKSQIDILRDQLTTRNVFAILNQASLTGFTLCQALTDVQERLEEWMPTDADAAGMVIDYLVGKGFDDLRGNLSAATSLLAWSESKSVRWEEGWIEAFVHCCGMYNRLETCPDFQYVSSISRALLERSSLEMQVRIHDAEQRLSDFDFVDMWPKMSSQSPPARESFEKAREFFLTYYKGLEGRWPPLTPAAEDQWLNRTWAQRLQADFGALYDYLVDRAIVWDGSEERSGRKWNIVKPGDRAFDVDTPDLPLTDVLVAFDNRHAFPHIPHPYCRVPASAPVKKPASDNMFKPNKRGAKPAEDKIAQTKAALAYTNSTNVFILGPDTEKNDLVEEFVKFEKSHFLQADPYAARRGRWVLIYGILQVLAAVSVDSPTLRYFDGMSYHMSPKLRGTPPWKAHQGAYQDDADHTQSHCWTVVDSWNHEPFRPVRPAGKGIPISVNTHIRGDQSAGPSASDSEGGSFKKLPVFSPTLSATSSSKRGARTRDSDKSDSYPSRLDSPSRAANQYGPRIPESSENLSSAAYSSRSQNLTSANHSFSRSDASGSSEQQQGHSIAASPRTSDRHDRNYTSRSRDREEFLGYKAGSPSRSHDAAAQYSSGSSSRQAKRSDYVPRHDGFSSTGYAPGIERVDEWPAAEEERGGQYGDGSRGYRPRAESRGNRKMLDTGIKEKRLIAEEGEGEAFRIRDFDDYGF